MKIRARLTKLQFLLVVVSGIWKKPFEKLGGVVSVYSGFTGGHKENPTYGEVESGTMGHLESVEVHYNPNVISYDELLQAFWRNIDPTDADGQFGDRGTPYQSAIFYTSNEQKELAEASKKELEASKRFDKPIVTKIAAATTFYKAEAEHQDFYKKSRISYQMSELLSSRDAFIEKVWGKDRERTKDGVQTRRGIGQCSCHPTTFVE